MDIHTLEYVIGALFVTLYSVDRINTPKINLATTTPGRYWSMVVAYAAASVLLYLALSLSLGLAGIETLKQFGFIPESVDTKSPPVLMAMLLTVLLSKIPGLSKLDEAVRLEFRQRASMSRIAGNLSHFLERSPLRLAPERQATIVAYLKDRGIDEKDIIFVDNQTAQYIWTRTTVLLYALRLWESDPAYGDFVTAFREEWGSLVETAEKHETMALRCFRLAKVAEADPALSSALKDCRQHYAEQLNTLLRQLSDFMGRGIASTCGNSSERRRLALAEIGLDVQSDVGYTVHQIAFVIMVTLAGSILLPLVARLVNHHETVLDRYIFKVAAGYAIAALVALSWHSRYNGLLPSGGQRPWERYLTVGALSVALTVVFSLALDLLSLRNPAMIFTKFWQWGFVFHLRPLVFGILMAYLIDTRVAQEKLRVRQWIETAT
ncbi:MAG TPA: hypothetical protein VJ608_00300, partial [Albitalea sp.]|nr:hypothetical protein [Albitalea sp.]